MSNNIYIHSKETARQVDTLAQKEYHIPSLLLMEHAAIECTKILTKKFDPDEKLCILCGPGNNGGDGLAIARLLANQGYTIFVSLPFNNKYSNEEAIQKQMLDKLPVETSSNLNTILKRIKHSDGIIDCLFGSGLSKDIQGNYETIIQTANQQKVPIYAIDIPSGIDATSGKILNTAIQADTTIAIDCLKQGYFIQPGQTHCGNIKLISIGIPEALHNKETHAQYINKELAGRFLPKRDKHAHKGNFSKALCIGGSLEMPGAITLTATAAEKSGIGTLTILEPKCIHQALYDKMNFAMHLSCPDIDGHFSNQSIKILKDNIQAYDLITIGNGMKQVQETKDLVQTVLQYDKITILDADALWALKDQKELLKRESLTILSPHIKEMTYLIDKTKEDILQDPFACIQEFTKQYPNCLLVLKSDTTYIAYQDKYFVYSDPNSAFSKGGSGDILCGLIAGLIGHKQNVLEAVVCAVYIHGSLAKIKKDPACISPEDLIEQIEKTIYKLRKRA